MSGTCARTLNEHVTSKDASSNGSAVYTRFDAPGDLPKILPPGTRLETARGIRIVTPAALAMRVPGLRAVLHRAERRLCDSAASRFGGFYVAVIRKGSA